MSCTLLNQKVDSNHKDLKQKQILVIALKQNAKTKAKELQETAVLEKNTKADFTKLLYIFGLSVVC